MNYTIKLGSFTFKGQEGNMPIDVEVKDVELSVEGVAIREIPQLLGAVKDFVSQLDNESFERELIREDINRNNTCPSFYSSIKPTSIGEVFSALMK